MKHLVFVAVVGLLPVLAMAADDGIDPYGKYHESGDYNENLEVPWLEKEVEVSALPVDDDLTELDLSVAPQGMRMYADLKNMAVGDDHVARLWVVAKSGNGRSYNGNYLGVRCSTGEYKVYAYGNPRRSKPVRQVEFPRWRNLRPGDYRTELAETVVCSGTRPRNPDDALGAADSDASSYQSPY